MRASYNWLRELTGVDLTPAEMAQRLTGAGLEVEAIEEKGAGLDLVVVARVLSKAKHPERDKLTVVRVDDGTGEVEVVCGAPNVPEPGGRVLFARVGAKLPNGMEIGERKLGGVLSRGMICSETELGIGEGEDGIVVLGDDVTATPGTSVADALALRDHVFEIGLTPNRPDCLGHVGIARDLAAVVGVPFTPPAPPKPARKKPGGPGAVIQIDDPERCPRYGAGLVEGVTVGPSPFWLRYRLHILGLRAIHNVVDATNYVLLEHGHPTHAFDLANVRERRIVVRLAKDGETMATLDGAERTFTADDLLICDGKGPVAVAGVMGGANSEIAETTRDVLVECAYFEPRSVRRTSRRLGLHTDASHRFERGVDPNAIPHVLARTTQLVADLSGGTVVGDGVDDHPRPVVPKKADLRLARANALLGFETSPADAERILVAIGCSVARGPGDVLHATLPTHRPDLGREVDLIEEILRVRGFDQLPTTIPHVRPSRDGTPKDVLFVRRARELAAAAGLNEAITYAFVAPHELAAARVPTAAVPLENPLSEDRSVMRTSLLPGLAAAVRRAQRRQVDRVALFELAHVFAPTEGVLPHETRELAFLMAGPRHAWIGDGDPIDFYDAKGMLEAIVGPLVGAAVVLAPSEALDARAPWAHPRRRAQVSVAGVDVGVVAELSPDVCDALELVGRAAGAILSVEALLEAEARVGVPEAQPLPRFPAVHRDLALEVDEEVPAGSIADAVRATSPALVEAVQVFDLYRGAQIPKGKKSLAFRITYRHPDETLTDKVVDAAHQQIVKAVTQGFHAVVR